MTLDVKFEEQDQTFNTDFGEVQTVSDGGFERGYNEGYAQGEVEGYDKGKTDGLVDGYDKGKTDGLVEGYDKGKTDGLVEGEQVGFDNAISKLTTLEVTENGEYTPSDDNIGFDKVTVNIGGREKTSFAEVIEGTRTTIIIDDMKGATKIGKRLFYNVLRNAENFEIPDTVEVIEDEAFYGATSLKAITIPPTVKTVGKRAFCSSGLIEVVLVNGPAYGNDIFQSCSYLQKIKIDEGITQLPYSMCNSCSALQEIEFPKNSLTTIGEYCFSACKKLVDITLPDSITSIGRACFRSCEALTNINLSKNLTRIELECFQYCKSLTSITIPSSVTYIAYSAFQYCDALTKINIEEGNNVYFDDGGVVYEKDALNGVMAHTYPYGKQDTDYKIPDGTRRVSSYFLQSKTLLSITIPSTITWMGDRCINWCSNLTTIIILATTPPSIYSTSISNNNLLNKIVVPKGCGDVYKSATNWSKYADIMEEATE